MAKKVVKKSAIKRKPGKLYFINGKGDIMETDMKRKKKK